MEMELNGLLVKLGCFPLRDHDRILGTMAETRPQAVTELVSDQFRLPVNDLKSPLRTIGDTESAPIAFFLVDQNNLSCCHVDPPSSFLN
jgi:hypothetical protein